MQWLLAACLLLSVAAAQTTVNGAGATFPYPMYSKWFSEYHKIHPEVQFNYQSIGSGGGIRQVLAGTVDFGATDGPMSDEQLSQAKGNEGVAGMVRQMEGALGYVELIYAEQNKIPYGTVKNAAGQFVKASLDSTTAAAASVKSMPADFRVSITNAPGKDAYPISSFTWLLVPAEWKDASKGRVMVDFLNWMLNEGQAMVQSLNYAPLPK